MVVQDVDDTPMEAHLSKQIKKYVVVKNHVRELLSEDEGSVVINNNKLVDKSKSVKRKVLKRKKGLQTQLPSVSETGISESDLEELKSVYSKCKAVIQKIESKYGYLLNLKDNEVIERYKNTSSEELSCDYCTCSQKKKFVFDENGQQIEKESHSDNHICIKRIKKSQNDSQPHSSSIQIEYDNIPNLPNNLQELENILKDISINKSYRRMVIDKIYLLRQEYLNEIRYEKQDIVKRLKENPDEVLDFKGTNLSSLHGYPIKPVKENKY